jgi:hypothetical protein
MRRWKSGFARPSARRSIVALGLLALLGADGDEWASYPALDKGDRACVGYLLCDAKVAADTSCSEFDLTSKRWGWPDYFVVSIITVDPQCTGNMAVQVRGKHTAGGRAYNLKSAVAVGGTESQKYPTPDHRYIDATLSGMAGCDAPGNQVALVICHDPR